MSLYKSILDSDSQVQQCTYEEANVNMDAIESILISNKFIHTDIESSEKCYVDESTYFVDKKLEFFVAVRRTAQCNYLLQMGLYSNIQKHIQHDKWTAYSAYEIKVSTVKDVEKYIKFFHIVENHFKLFKTNPPLVARKLCMVVYLCLDEEESFVSVHNSSFVKYYAKL